MLLVFDNIEHFLSDAGLFAEMLEWTPTVELLMTSREVLNLSGEWVFDDARDQRLALYLNFAEEAERKFRDAGQLIWRGRLEQSHSGVIMHKRSRGVLAVQGQAERGARLLRAAAAIRETTGAAAWATGRRASRDQAIA